MEKEKISIQKAVKGIIEPRNYVKAGVFSMNIGVMVIIVIGIVTVFNFFFGTKKTQTQTQNSSFTVQSGATVEHLTVNSSQEQKNNDKTVGLEGTLSSKDLDVAFVRYFNDNLSTGIGIRYVFDARQGETDALPIVKVRWDF